MITLQTRFWKLMVERGPEAAQRSWCVAIWAANVVYLSDTTGASDCNSTNKCIFPSGDKYMFTDTSQMLTAKPVILNNETEISELFSRQCRSKSQSMIWPRKQKEEKTRVWLVLCWDKNQLTAGLRQQPRQGGGCDGQGRWPAATAPPESQPLHWLGCNTKQHSETFFCF